VTSTLANECLKFFSDNSRSFALLQAAFIALQTSLRLNGWSSGKLNTRSDDGGHCNFPSLEHDSVNATRSELTDSGVVLVQKNFGRFEPFSPMARDHDSDRRM